MTIVLFNLVLKDGAFLDFSLIKVPSLFLVSIYPTYYSFAYTTDWFNCDNFSP